MMSTSNQSCWLPTACTLLIFFFFQQRPSGQQEQGWCANLHGTHAEAQHCSQRWRNIQRIPVVQDQGHWSQPYFNSSALKGILQSAQATTCMGMIPNHALQTLVVTVKTIEAKSLDTYIF